jgi:RNA polymerase sigma factor (sigma-70 family)
VETFAEQVAAARPRVVAVVARLVGEDAEDVVQEAVLRAFLSLSALRDSERFEAWLCGIALNVAKTRLRRAATEARVLAATVPTATATAAGDERELLDAVRDAVALLPPGQREAVLLHYVDDLSCDEVAELLGSTPGAVRVRLHRARAQLRSELALHAPLTRTKEETMIELRLADVLVSSGGNGMPETAIVLQEKDGDRTLRIWVGAPEGISLGYRVVGEQPQRPLTSDLMAELLRATGAHVDSVAITELRDQVFYGLVTVDGADVDARPSDAINLAVRVGAPILVEERVLEAAAACPGPDGEWASITADVLRAFSARPKKE